MKISTFLKRNKMSQRRLCTKIGLSHNAISNYINGKRKPSKEIIRRLEVVMNTKNVELK